MQRLSRLFCVFLLSLVAYICYPTPAHQNVVFTTGYQTCFAQGFVSKEHSTNNSDGIGEDTAFAIFELLLPDRSTWPDPVQKVYAILTIDRTIRERTKNMEWVKLTEIPTETQQALIAIEDHDFYNHGAIAIDGILRALLVNITAGEVVQGGSTLTQQLAKNLFLNDEQTLSRKIFEAFFALMLEDKYSKDEILEMYFNTTYLGNGSTGILAASRSYFGKLPSQLNLSESAIIAALPYAPSALNPYENPQECKKRQRLVIDTMVKRNLIGDSVAKAAKETPVYLANGSSL